MTAAPFLVARLPVQREDEAFLEQLFHLCQAPDFALLGMPAPALAQLLAMQYRGRNMTYAATYPFADDHLVTVNGERAGRITLNYTPEAIHLIDLAVAPGYRGRGIATQLLRELLAEAVASGRNVQLHVRGSNPAVRLYQRLGFVVSGGDGFQHEMTWSPTTAGSPAAATEEGSDAPQAVAPPSSSDLVPDTSSVYFRSLLGCELTARHNTLTVPLILRRVEAIALPKGSVARGDSFTLTFTGPLEPILPCDSINLTPAQGDPLEIFLSPTGPEAGSMMYEAVFNRAT